MVRDLDDLTVLVQPRYLDWLKNEIKKNTENLTYQVPVPDKRM